MTTLSWAPFRLAAVAAAALAAGSGTAQEAQRVASETDWAIFAEDDPKECWSVSAPKESVNTRDGRVVAVRRGDILLFVYYRPNEAEKGVVAYTGGYPFAGGSTVTLEVADTSFELFTEGEWAWPASPADDAKLITALKRGSEATVTARSARGTQTKDTFSLLGFTAALDEAEKRCTQ